MRKLVMMAAGSAAVLAGLGPGAEAQQPSPLPPAALPRPLPKPKPPTIALQEIEESGPRGLRGASQTFGRKSIVKADGAALTATMTGTATAYNAVACPGEALAANRLVQPFDITPDPGSSPFVIVTLAAKAEGYLHATTPATASLRTASVAVYPAGGGPPLALALPTAAIADGGRGLYQQSAALPPMVLPAGRYVLVMDLAVGASVASHFHGYGSAIFAPEFSGRDTVVVSDEGLVPDNYGFTAVLKAEPLPP